MKGRRHAPADTNQDTSFEDGRLIRLAMLFVAVYLFIGFMPLMRWSAVNHNWIPLVTHVVALSVCVFFALGDVPRPIRPVRDWMGIALIFLFAEDIFVEPVFAIQQRINPREEPARLSTLDDPVIVGAGHHHDFSDAQRCAHLG